MSLRVPCGLVPNSSLQPVAFSDSSSELVHPDRLLRRAPRFRAVCSCRASAASVANDFQQPGAPVRPKLKALKGLEGTQVRFLNDVLCVTFITRKPPRKVKSGIQVGRQVSSKLSILLLLTEFSAVLFQSSSDMARGRLLSQQFSSTSSAE
jgi:hypothetical protein